MIEKTDLYRAMRPEYITEIERSDDTLVPHCISAAESEVKTYLREAFDISAIFGAVGTDRNSLLVTFIADIAVYNLVELAPVGVDIEQVRLRYKRAIEWLKGVQTGTLKPDLPILENNIVNQAIVWGSKEKKINNY